MKVPVKVFSCKNATALENDITKYAAQFPNGTKFNIQYQLACPHPNDCFYTAMVIVEEIGK